MPAYCTPYGVPVGSNKSSSLSQLQLSLPTAQSTECSIHSSAAAACLTAMTKLQLPLQGSSTGNGIGGRLPSGIHVGRRAGAVPWSSETRPWEHDVACLYLLYLSTARRTPRGANQQCCRDCHSVHPPSVRRRTVSEDASTRQDRRAASQTG
ncbi:hypothetical protein BO71DRAFT_397080 [Aspergillus ellipticus CBS 707.79]|uniref:Uncharacterized protein n=1 Tax=Aspergillus ellipticus CBS 707.79 TaxID=1448320 RepID=A0A319DG86_9EURO|nr:hypothetical protein BO71DRAFT_397080 [Aspergillus ellipticus CBS 707.79]